ncbi:MAG: C69 family dipeptidase [Candidatus Bathyarchaeota archaeon]|nr:C69 family dipeptidase [Candidatus Bathyarchaeota archaeon]
MNKRPLFYVLSMLLVCLITVNSAFASTETSCCKESSLVSGCTSFCAGKKATVEKYTMAGHTCDGRCDFTLTVVPGAKHEPGDVYRMYFPGIPGGYEHTSFGEIPQVDETYSYFHNEVPFANEYQVFVGENTCYTREEAYELTEEEALLDWMHATALGLQRAKTAREYIKKLGKLIEEYGLDGTGESYTIIDPDEAWIMELPGYSRQWVAQRVPDDHVCPHTMRFKIKTIDLNKPDWYMASPNLINLAVEKGLYDPDKDGPFNFWKVYSGDVDRANTIREWRIFSLLCPSKDWDPDAVEFPFSVKPEKKISVEWWINTVWRDYLEGTPYDRTKGIVAGPFGCPETPNIEGLSEEKGWLPIIGERTICSRNTAYSWVAQARSKLPNWIGGCVWYGLDCPSTTCYVPFYVGITDVPAPWKQGNFNEFSDNSAYWLFQVLETFSCLRYKDMIKDIHAAFGSIEDKQFTMQSYIEKMAVDFYKKDPTLAQDFLTNYCNGRALEAESAARNLFKYLALKYADEGPETTISKEWMNLIKEDMKKR